LNDPPVMTVVSLHYFSGEALVSSGTSRSGATIVRSFHPVNIFLSEFLSFLPNLQLCSDALYF